MGQATIRALQRHHGGHNVIGLVRTLSKAIKALPGRKLIYTNGSRAHAEAVADRLGISEHFEGIFDIVAADLEPKPDPAPYDKFFSVMGVDPTRAAMFEDLPKNLRVPKNEGMVTTLLVPQGTPEVFHEEWELEKQDGDPVDFVTDDMTAFLQEILAVIR